MASRRRNSEYILDLPVQFGNISIGERNLRVGVTVDRQYLAVNRADQQICEKRLTGVIIARPAGEQEDQGSLQFEGEPIKAGSVELRGVFDVKSFRVSLEQISFGLTFAVASVDVEAISHFANRSGRLQVENFEAIPEPVAAEANGEAVE